MEKRVEVRPVSVTLICDKCGKEMGYEMYSGIDTNITYRYSCLCGHKVETKKRYPRIEYEEIGDV